MFRKKPDCLTAEEVDKFNSYINWKSQSGEPIEEDIIYNPAEGNKNCLHCDMPTWRLDLFYYCMCDFHTFPVNNVHNLYFYREVNIYEYEYEVRSYGTDAEQAQTKLS